jgi:hypothetical protein
VDEATVEIFFTAFGAGFERRGALWIFLRAGLRL